MDAVGLSPETVHVPGRRHAQFRKWGRRVSMWLPIVFAVAVVVAWIDGYQMHVVRSGSMSPTLHVGDMTFGHTVDAESIKHGDIVTFRDPAARNALVTHRVLTVTPQDGQLKVVTRGDANTGWETWSVPQDSSVESTPYSIPYLGRVVTDRWVGLGFGLALVALAAWLAFAMIRGAHQRREAMRAQLVAVPPRLHRMHWLPTGWVAFGAAVLMVTTPAYSVWTATDTNANTLNSASTFVITQSYDNSNCTQQSYAVPAGKTSVQAVLIGGSGNSARSGAKLDITFTVVGGTDTVFLYVGCNGAANSAATGGTGGAGYMTGFAGGNGAGFGGLGGGGGGGASAVCKGTCATTTNIEGIAGGGGGNGNTPGTAGNGGSGVTNTNNTVNSGKGFDGTAGAAGNGAGGAGGGHTTTFKGGGSVGTNASSTSPSGGGGGGGGGYNGGTGGTGGPGFAPAGGGGGGDGSSWYLSTATLNVTPPTGTGTPGSVVLTIS